MTLETAPAGEAHGHQHRDVSGGWLRPAVFGAMDGLVTNVSLIAGVGAGRLGPQVFLLVAPDPDPTLPDAGTQVAATVQPLPVAGPVAAGAVQAVVDLVDPPA